ncbi:MAG: hypothetical protein LQ348_007362 [Seirophora lacunosa]|nr:MAG: hypothetical protein LQ348_007362 [Seirophora lacunosa]
MARQMFAALRAAFQHAVETHHLELGSGWQERLRQADEDSRRGTRDVEILMWIRTVLEQLHYLESADLIDAMNALADASRDVSWRSPMEQSGLLEFSLEFFLDVSASPNPIGDLLRPALRLIGNSCADNDVNREVVISPEYPPVIIGHLHDSKLTPITIPVIHNICNHYERAQHVFRIHGLCPALVDVLKDSDLQPGPLVSSICTLLEFSSQQSDLAQCPEYSLQIILQFMQEQKQALDPSDMLQLISTANAFLQQQIFQMHFVEQGLVNHLLDAIIHSYTYENEGPEAQEELSFLRSSITRLLSDVSATTVFANKYSVESPVIASLIHWLSDTRDQMRICSCLMLGNLARSDAVCLNMVRRLRLHERLLQMMRDQTSMQVVYAALGFLRNLALPAENKAMVGTLQSIEVISSLWSLNLNPQVQHASVSLLRQILNGCIGNVRWLLEPLSPDPDSPAHEKTYLSLLLLLFGRTDDVSTKVEIGRTVATICRCIATSSQGLPQGSTSAILHRLYAMHADIARPLAMMTTQSRFPIIRSEGWFALALMARSKEGSAAVSEVLHQMEVFGALVTTITGQSTNGHGSPSAQQRSNTGNTSRSGSNSSDTRSEQEREMQAKDRENALVLVNELLKNTGDEVSVIRRSILEDLMHGPQSPAGAQELMTRAESEDRAE